MGSSTSLYIHQRDPTVVSCSCRRYGLELKLTLREARNAQWWEPAVTFDKAQLALTIGIGVPLEYTRSWGSQGWWVIFLYWVTVISYDQQDLCVPHWAVLPPITMYLEWCYSWAEQVVITFRLRSYGDTKEEILFPSSLVILECDIDLTVRRYLSCVITLTFTT